ISMPQARAVRDVLSTCIPCNIMCMRMEQTGHVRYNHVHHIEGRTVCITVHGTRSHYRPPPYYYCVFVSDSGTLRTDGLLVPGGHYPI
ncbi:hypothetical protein FKP32DRAFT_1540085, partial [Trametes sanguinea]